MLGAALVFFMFPKKAEEQTMLAQYSGQDAAQVEETAT
jgi:hypothetical protein